MNNVHDRLLRALPWGLIPLATLIIYLPAIHGGLIMDDAEHITPSALQSFAGLARIWFEVGSTPHYYPVLNSFFWLEHHLWGASPVGYHLSNIFQHAGAACLVVLVARRLKLAGPVLAGFIFALHPVHVESVAWISEQKNTLSTLLGLGATLVYLDYRLSLRRTHYWLASVLFLLALLTKTVVAVIPPALLVVIWWQNGRLAWRRDVIPLLPWFVIGAALGLFSAWFEQVHSHAQGDVFQLSFLERTLIAGRAVCFYARTLAWPSDLMYINPRWTVDVKDPLAYGGALLVIAVGVGLLLAVRKSRGPLATFLLFVGMLFPVLGFLNINWFNFSYVANHFQYLPSVGVIVPLVAVFSGALQRLAVHSGVRLAVQVALVAGVGWVARSHCEDYRTPRSLYASTLEKNPDCWLAHNNLGVLLLEEPDQLAQASRHFERALALKPDHARAHNNYATALLRADRLEEALEHYRQSLALQDRVPEVHFNYAQALIASGGSTAEVLAHFDRALELQPDYAEAHLGRAETLASVPGRTAEAIAAYRKAIQLNPNSAEAYNNLGAILGNDEGSLTEAIRLLSRAVQLAPDYADAHFNLGLLLTKIPGQREEAIARMAAAVRLRPEDADAHHSLAAMLLRSGDGVARAVTHLEAIVRLRPDSAPAHVSLAQVLAQIPGRADEALAHYRRALALDPDNRAAREALAGDGTPR